MHVAVDMDDVVLDFMGSVIQKFGEEYDVKVEYDGVPWGDLAVAFTKHPFLLESGYKDWWGWLKDRHWLWATFPAVRGAIGGIQRLRARGHFIELVTSKPEWADGNVWKWLGRWRVPLDQVTITRFGQRKVDMTLAEVIVDDKRQTCEEFAADGRWAIYFHRGAGEPQPGPRLFVARNWHDVVNIIDQLDKEL